MNFPWINWIKALVNEFDDILTVSSIPALGSTDTISLETEGLNNSKKEQNMDSGTTIIYLCILNKVFTYTYILVKIIKILFKNSTDKVSVSKISCHIFGSNL